MISTIVRWSLHHRIIVLCFSAILFAWGVYASQKIPLIAIQDITELQVIVKTSFPGQPPQIVEEQVTLPISKAMLSVPKAIKVKGYSLYGDSYVYVSFNSDVDIYWARARVYEILNQVNSQLPISAESTIGPDGTRVGWVYEYALIDKTDRHDLAELRLIHDRYLKPELQIIPDVSEVATIGGMVKQFQIVLDPNRLRAYSISINKVIESIKQASLDVGGSVIEIAEAEYMVSSQNSIEKISDIETIPLEIGNVGTPIMLRDVASVRIGPQMRRGIAELNGEGEVVGGVVIVRRGGDELSTISAVKKKIAILKAGLPVGVEVIETYDRSRLIERSLKNILILFMVAIISILVVCLIFNINALFVLVVIPLLGIILSSIAIYYQGLSVSIVTIGVIIVGLVIVIDSLVLIVDKIRQDYNEQDKDVDILVQIEGSFSKLSASILFSYFIKIAFILIIVTSFEIEKTYHDFGTMLVYILISSAVMSITILPVLLYYTSSYISQRNTKTSNLKIVTSIMTWGLYNPVKVITFFILFILSVTFPLSSLKIAGSVHIDEGDLIYSPTLLSGVSIGKAGELLQITNRLISEVPEVKTVFGKVGHAETATDSMPLTKIETLISLHPKDEWRDGVTIENIKARLDDKLKLPGVINDWSMPIQSHNYIAADNFVSSTGVKIIGTDSRVIHRISTEIKKVLSDMPRISVINEKDITESRYINIKINRRSAARYGLNIADIQVMINHAIGGASITTTTQGFEQTPVNVRFPQSERSSILKLKMLPLISPTGIHLTLGDVTEIVIKKGASQIVSENTKQFVWVFFNTNYKNIDVVMPTVKNLVKRKINLPSGYSLSWSNQIMDARKTKNNYFLYLSLILIAIILLMFAYYGSVILSLVSWVSFSVTLVGAFWGVYILGFNLSTPAGIGILIISGLTLSVNAGMLVYLKQAITAEKPINESMLNKLIIINGKMSIRSSILPIALIIVILTPIMVTQESGLEVLQNIAAPMIGGVITILVSSILLIPVLYKLWQRKKFDISTS